MTDKEWLYVSTLAECKSVTKAAERLYIAQPSLTQALHRIETEYGTPFFHRSRDGLRLTPAGRAYLDAAEKMNWIYERMKDEIGTMSKGQRESVSLGITAVLGGILLPKFLSLHRQRSPLVKLDLVERSSTQLEQLAFEQRLDIIVLHRPFRDYDLDYVPLHQEEIYLAVPPDDPDYLAASRNSERPFATREIMARQQFNMLTSNQRSRQVADSICAAAGIEPKLHFTTTNFSTALALTESGMGATLIPRSFACHYAGHYAVAFFRLPAAWNATWELVAAYSKNFPIAQAHLDVIRSLQECIASMPEVY